MTYKLSLEESYTKDYRFLPISLMQKKQRAVLSNDDLIVASVLREIEAAAASRKTPKWDAISVFFDITLCTMKLKYGFTSYRTRQSLKNLFNAGIITDPSKDQIRFTKKYSGFEQNKNFAVKMGYHARREQGIRIPRFLDQYDFLSATDKICFSILLNRAMNGNLRDDDGRKYTRMFHEEMMEKLSIKSVTSMLSCYDHLQKAGLIERAKNSFDFFFPGLPIVIKKTAEKEESTKPLEDACNQVSPIIFSASNLDSAFVSETRPTIEREYNKKQVQDSLSLDSKYTETARTEDEGSQPQKLDAKEQIRAEKLFASYPDKAEMIQNILDRMDFVYNCRADRIRVGGAFMKREDVIKRLQELTFANVVSILSWIGDELKKVGEMGRNNYTLTCLYNYQKTTTWKHGNKKPGLTGSSGYGYKDNKYIPSNHYDYDAILEEHRRRLYEGALFTKTN